VGSWNIRRHGCLQGALTDSASFLLGETKQTEANGETQQTEANGETKQTEAAPEPWRVVGRRQQGQEAGSSLRIVDSCIAQLKAQGP
jgi:hypothetical protein